MRKTRFLEVAGVLTIISSCFTLLISLSYMFHILAYNGWAHMYTDQSLFSWLVIINCFGFPLGLTGGILALLRKHFILTTSGMAILLFSHVLSVVLPIYRFPQYLLDPTPGFEWGTPLIIISALGLIITIKNREAFD